METYPDFGYGQRPDGTNKGPGFAAQILPDGAVMTEYSLGPAGALYPAVYQGITPWDMETLSNVYQYGYDRAYQSSLLRAMQGQPPFWTPADGMPGTVQIGAGYMPR